MTHYQEYTLFLPPDCPTMWDHITRLPHRHPTMWVTHAAAFFV